MIDIDQLERDIERLVAVAIDAASSLEELLDAARAAAAVGTSPLLEAVAARIGQEVSQALTSSGAWEAELAYSKVNAWEQTGHRAHLLAEAWGLIAPGLRAGQGAARDSKPRR